MESSSQTKRKKKRRNKGVLSLMRQEFYGFRKVSRGWGRRVFVIEYRSDAIYLIVTKELKEKVFSRVGTSKIERTLINENEVPIQTLSYQFMSPQYVDGEENVLRLFSSTTSIILSLSTPKDLIRFLSSIQDLATPTESPSSSIVAPSNVCVRCRRRYGDLIEENKEEKSEEEEDQEEEERLKRFYPIQAHFYSLPTASVPLPHTHCLVTSSKICSCCVSEQESNSIVYVSFHFFLMFISLPLFILYHPSPSNFINNIFYHSFS